MAFSFCFFIFFVFAMLQMCFIFFMYHTAGEAAREGARWASVRGPNCADNPNLTNCPLSSTTPSDDVKTFIQNNIVGGAMLTVNTTWCAASTVPASCSGTTPAAAGGAGGLVQVKATYNILSWVRSLLGLTSTFNGFVISSTSQHVMWN